LQAYLVKIIVRIVLYIAAIANASSGSRLLLNSYRIRAHIS